MVFESLVASPILVDFAATTTGALKDLVDVGDKDDRKQADSIEGTGR